VAALDRVREIGPEWLLGSHIMPIQGRDQIHQIVTTYRDATQWLWDQSIRHINKGYTPVELQHKLRDVPEHLWDAPYSVPTYGTPWTAVPEFFTGWVLDEAKRHLADDDPQFAAETWTVELRNGILDVRQGSDHTDTAATVVLDTAAANALSQPGASVSRFRGGPRSGEEAGHHAENHGDAIVDHCRETVHLGGGEEHGRGHPQVDPAAAAGKRPAGSRTVGWERPASNRRCLPCEPSTSPCTSPIFSAPRSTTGACSTSRS